MRKYGSMLKPYNWPKLPDFQPHEMKNESETLFYNI